MRSGTTILPLLLLAAAAMAAETSPASFDDVAVGSLPKGWEAGVTGSGSPKWTVIKDDTAPSMPNVLAQTGVGTYPFCMNTAASLQNGFVEVKFKPVSGKEDQAGGLIWRFKDKDNYYIARANALEDNITIYRTVAGNRRYFKNVNMKVAGGVWHALRVDFSGNHFVVTFDGQKALDASDATFPGAGAVGVWTKADSVTYFDDFQFGPVPK